MGILLLISGYWADVCQVKGYLTTTQVRRYFNCGGEQSGDDSTYLQLYFFEIFGVNFMFYSF